MAVIGDGGGGAGARTSFCLTTSGNCDLWDGFVTYRDLIEMRLLKKFGTSNIEWCSGIENIFRNSLNVSVCVCVWWQKQEVCEKEKKKKQKSSTSSMMKNNSDEDDDDDEYLAYLIDFR